jgi:hypothetical protein
MLKRRRPQSLARWRNRKPGPPTPSDGDIVYGDIAMRTAVRFVPLVGAMVPTNLTAGVSFEEARASRTVARGVTPFYLHFGEESATPCPHARPPIHSRATAVASRVVRSH